jgi:hypothetical protein
MGAGRIFPRVGEVEILGDEETLFHRASMPDFIIGFTGEILVKDAMDIVLQGAKTALQGEREILVELDPHAAAVCKTGRSSRAEAAA